MNFTDYPLFLDELFRRLNEVGVNVTGLEMDHIAIKTETADEFFELKPELAKIGQLRHENLVRGRRVLVYELNNPWKYQDYLIPAVELISPIEGVDVLKTGFEHAEFVLRESFAEFMAKYPSLKWDTSVMNSDLFAMIKLKLGEDMQVKFHLMPILEIIKKEK